MDELLQVFRERLKIGVIENLAIFIGQFDKFLRERFQNIKTKDWLKYSIEFLFADFRLNQIPID